MSGHRYPRARAFFKRFPWLRKPCAVPCVAVLFLLYVGQGAVEGALDGAEEIGAFWRRI